MESIPDIREKIKSWLENENIIHILMAFIVLLVGLAGFGLGRLSLVSKEPVKIEYPSNIAVNQAVANVGQAQDTVKTPENAGGSIVASKNGTKYYLPGCSGASRIKDENKVYFTDEASAKVAGYSIAANCK